MKQMKLLWIILPVALIPLLAGILYLAIIRKQCADSPAQTTVHVQMTPRVDQIQPVKKPDGCISTNGISEEDAIVQRANALSMVESGTNSTTPSLSHLFPSEIAQGIDHKTAVWDDACVSLQNKEMATRLKKALEIKEQAETELEEIQRSVKEGKLTIEQSRGLSLSVIKGAETLAVVIYDSPAGPVRSYSKNVYNDANYQKEINSLGYELHYYTNGVLKEFFRRDKKDTLFFGTKGELMRFAAEKPDAPYYYLVEWDANGKLLHEGYPRGIIGEIKDGKYIKHPSHPDYNQESR